jgi:CRP/FNR family cyclic AMP-dependent transcriptional regulator
LATSDPVAGAPESVQDFRTPTLALARNAMFSALPVRRHADLAASGHRVNLAPGQALFRVGDTSEAIFVVLTGEVEVTVPARDGRQVWLAKLGPGALVGEMGVLDGGPRSADVCAVRRTELWRIGRRTILDALLDEPAAAIELLAIMSRRLRDTDRLLQEKSLLGLGARLAQLLLEVNGPAISLSQGEMARLIGASRERVNRKLAEWRGEGWVDLGTYGVKVLDRGALFAEVSPNPVV